jgi:hypothetical protein
VPVLVLVVPQLFGLRLPPTPVLFADILALLM